jgi:hypothetical protein
MVKERMGEFLGNWFERIRDFTYKTENAGKTGVKSEKDSISPKRWNP